jgi:hypothetical protein
MGQLDLLVAAAAELRDARELAATLAAKFAPKKARPLLLTTGLFG